MNEETAECVNGWVKLWTKHGALVTLPVTEKPLDYAAMLANIGAAIDAGWLVHAPGLEAGEHKFTVEAVCRRTKHNKSDGTHTPVIDLYEHGNDFKSFSHYIDDVEDLAAFEYASGLRLGQLPTLPGDAALKRGGPDADKFIVVAPRPFDCIVKPNPKHNPAETDLKLKKPKWLFVRWADELPKAAASNGQQDKVMPNDLFNKWLAYISQSPTAAQLDAAWGNVTQRRNQFTDQQWKVLEGARETRSRELGHGAADGIGGARGPANQGDHHGTANSPRGSGPGGAPAGAARR